MDQEITFSFAYNASNASPRRAEDIDASTVTFIQTAEQLQVQQATNGSVTNLVTSPMVRPVKKVKISQAAMASRLAPKSHRRKTLSTLLMQAKSSRTKLQRSRSQVLGHLSPRDLNNISRTTKFLRATLLDKSAATVWKVSRQRLGGPDSPRNISQRAWAILIFTTICTSCGANQVREIDFLLRRRMCKKCKARHLIKRADLLDEYPGMGLAILNLIAPTFAQEDTFWRPDIDRMSETMASYQARIILGDDTAAQELARYKLARIQIVKEMREDAIISNASAESVKDEKLRLQKAAMLQFKIRTAIDRFHSLGYLDEDMPNLASEREITRDGRMLEPIWRRLRERVEPMYFRNKELRREREDRVVRISRRTMADGVYRSFAMTIPPSQWRYLPSSEVVCGMQPFRDLIAANADVPVTEESFVACLGELPRALEDARLRFKRHHIGVAPALFPGQDWSDASLQKAFTMLELVKNSYRCFTNANCDQCLFGWDEISSHHCSMNDRNTSPETSLVDSFKVGIFDDDKPRFREEFPNLSRYNRDMIVYVAYVARVSGFPGTSATVAQMDSADLRYTCSLCNIDSTKAIAYTWRGCAEHLNRTHADREARFRGLMKLNPAARRAGDDMVTTLCQRDTDWVKGKEQELERGADSRWACSHCPAHLMHSIQYMGVLQHVRETHDIDNPQEFVDLISLRRVRKDYAIEFEPTLQFSETPPAIF